jgi:predicted transposase YdaD
MNHIQFRYQAIRVWQLPPEQLLTGGTSLLALAPISDVTQAALPGIIKQMDQRLRHPRERKHASTVWAAAYFLSGLRYSPQLAASLFQRVVSMKESSTYQAILEEGRNEGRVEGQSEGALAEAKKLLRRLGEKALGTPDVRTVKSIEKLNDVNRLEELCERASTARSLQELLGSSTIRRNRKA